MVVVNVDCYVHMAGLTITAQFTPTVNADDRLKRSVAGLLRQPLQNPTWTVPDGEDQWLADKSSPLSDKAKWAAPSLEVRVAAGAATTHAVLASVAARLSVALLAVRRSEERLPISVRIDGSNGTLELAWRVQDPAGEIKTSLELERLKGLDVGPWGWAPDEGRWFKL
jgi:hypothetical protein